MLCLRRHNIKIAVALIKTRCEENAESSLPSTHNKSIYFLLLFFFPFQRILDISVRAAGMRSRRYKQDSRIKRKFLSGASILPFSLFLLSLENERKRRNGRGRTPAASARFHDNYLHQIESRLELHGGKQKNPPLARMLTRQQKDEEEDSEPHPRVSLLFLPTTASHILGGESRAKGRDEVLRIRPFSGWTVYQQFEEGSWNAYFRIYLSSVNSIGGRILHYFLLNLG